MSNLLPSGTNSIKMSLKRGTATSAEQTANMCLQQQYTEATYSILMSILQGSGQHNSMECCQYLKLLMRQTQGCVTIVKSTSTRSRSNVPYPLCYDHFSTLIRRHGDLGEVRSDQIELHFKRHYLQAVPTL